MRFGAATRPLVLWHLDILQSYQVHKSHHSPNIIYVFLQVDPKKTKKRRRANLVALTELSCISSGWTRAGFVGSNQTATPSLSLSFTLTHVVLQLLRFHTLSLSPSLPLLLPPSTTSSAVAPPLVPTFPPKPQEWHQGHKPSPARPTPPPACPRLPHGAPCTLGARVLQRARNSTVCVCLRACVLACRLDSSTIVHRTAHPEVAPRCRTGRRESCIPVTGCFLAPLPTTHTRRWAPGRPQLPGMFFWKV